MTIKSSHNIMEEQMLQSKLEQLETIKMLNSQLEQVLNLDEAANRTKARFLFNMSHDIRTPMNAIIGYTELIEQNLDNKEKCKEYLSKIRSSSNFLMGLINNVLEMARIENGEIKVNEEPGIIGTVIDDLFNIYSNLMDKKGITFTRDIDVKTLSIYYDRVKINEIFLNLLSNAYKYTPKGKSIYISIKELPSEREGYIKIVSTISDTGVGMSEDYLPHIFDKFSREQSYTENKIQGTGLGLPIVKKLVDMMGGTITVESEQGKGTTFVLTLEHRVASENIIQPQNNTIEKYPDYSGKRVLLAEDNELNAEIAMELLSATGMKVDIAEDGMACVDKLMKMPANTYDAVLMDIQMPNLDGYDATRQIRNCDDTQKANIPIIAMTANTFDEDMQNAFEAGMNYHISKPIDVPKLMKTLATIFTQDLQAHLVSEK